VDQPVRARTQSNTSNSIAGIPEQSLWVDSRLMRVGRARLIVSSSRSLDGAGLAIAA